MYGQDPKLRAELARRGLGYVLAVAKSHPVTTYTSSSVSHTINAYETSPYT